MIQVGSPTALAQAAVETSLVREAHEGEHGLYIPAGAFWGGQDIQKMADRGTLKVSSVNLLMCESSVLPTAPEPQGDHEEAPLGLQADWSSC